MMFGFSTLPYKMIGIVLLLVITNGITALTIYNRERDKHAAKEAALLQAELEKQSMLQAKMAALEAKAHEVRTVEIERVKYIAKEVRRVIREPVYTNPACVLTDDGVRIYNAAAAGVRLASASTPPAAVSSEPTAASGRGKSGRPAGGDRGSVRTVPRLPAKSG